MRGAADGCGDGAHSRGVGVGEFASRVVGQPGAIVHRTPRRGLGDSAMPAENGPKFGLPAHSLHWHSRTSAKSGLRARLIRENIIGHGVAGIAPCIASRRSFNTAHRSGRAFASLARGRALALLHQPTRQHSRGIFFQPGIQQVGDLLAKIGRVAQTREFVALQGIAGSGEKKFPGRLGFVGAHGDLQGKHCEITIAITVVNSTHVPAHCGKVCKSFARNCEQGSFTGSGLETP